jgi:hypothetical protein
MMFNKTKEEREKDEKMESFTRELKHSYIKMSTPK